LIDTYRKIAHWRTGLPTNVNSYVVYSFIVMTRAITWAYSEKVVG